jgi:D-alanine-D-alanine ligase
MHQLEQPNHSTRRLDADVMPSHGDLTVLQEQIERLKSHLRLAVIFSGDKAAPGSVLYKSTSTRPWKSYEPVAQDIATSLRMIGFRHVQLMPEDMNLPDRLRREGIHLAWLNSGGVQGYNPTSHASAAFEMLGIPYVGHHPLAATMLDNKHVFKHEAMSAGMPTAPFCTWNMTRGPFRPEINSRFRRAFADYSGSFVVKPVSGRASLHVHHITDRAGLPDAVSDVYRATRDLVLVEKFLPGREFCIAVTGHVVSQAGRLSRHRDPFTLSALERMLVDDEKIFTSMDVRSITNDRFRLLDSLQSTLVERMRRLACEVFFEFNLQSLIRIDLRTDENGDLFVLEANPKPDLKRPGEGVTSLICGGLPASGMNYDDLILSLLADRIDFLFSHRREAVQHIIDLLDPRTGLSAGRHQAAAIPPTSLADSASGQGTSSASAAEIAAKSIEDAGAAVERINDLAAEANLRVLNTIMARAGKSDEPVNPDQTGHRSDKVAAGST